MDLTTSPPILLVFRHTRDQLMWFAQPCSAFDIVVVVLRDHRELVHDFSTELGKVATLSKLNFNNMDLSRRRNGANFTSYSNESLCENTSYSWLRQESNATFE